MYSPKAVVRVREKREDAKGKLPTWVRILYTVSTHYNYKVPIGKSS